MSILWIYDRIIDPQAGGTERSSHLIMTALAERGYPVAGSLVFRQEHPRAVYDMGGDPIDDLYEFMKSNEIHVVVNQIGYSKWLLEEFLGRGGQRWKDEGGRIITCLHFDPLMFTETLRDLGRHWRRKTLIQKVRRLARMALLPIATRRAAQDLRAAYAYLISKSDYFVILSEKHRNRLYDLSKTQHGERVRVISNPRTYLVPYEPSRLGEKGKIALIVSRLDEPQKRVSLALLAWGEVMRRGGLDDWTLMVVGDGVYADDYRELVWRKAVRNVQFVGRADPEKYYEVASIYLHTAKREGWGLTILEAMHKGVVPIVMNSSAVFQDFIADGENGVLSPDGDVRAFARHIAELLANQDERERMARCAIEAAGRKDMDEVIESWSDLIDPISRRSTSGSGKGAGS